LAAVLALAVAAVLAGQRSVLAGQRSVLAIAEWGAREDGPLLAALGFPDDRTPCQSTLQRRFRHLDSAALAAVLAAHVAPVGVPTADL